ncbi:hypothetical protein TYRP_021045 [Tyrophagus putrescentiae]|nr:hypothetical protein TYRP_021045 [Tyrophagus putrescentiae]
MNKWPNAANLPFEPPQLLYLSTLNSSRRNAINQNHCTETDRTLNNNHNHKTDLKVQHKHQSLPIAMHSAMQ